MKAVHLHHMLLTYTHKERNQKNELITISKHFITDSNFSPTTSISHRGK